MLEGRASATATLVARLRAAHQILDEDPKVLVDAVAVGLVPASREEELRADAETLQTPYLRAIRALLVMRSRYVEDVLEEVAATGTRQYVNLGAGLDTFAHRQPLWARALTLFEVDHPATQQWKRASFQRLGIAPPANLRWCPVDFETTSLRNGLVEAGFDLKEPSCLSWLGVTQYLTEAAINSTLDFVCSLPGGSSIVFTFILPESCLESEDRQIRSMVAERTSSLGEPFLTEFEPAVLCNRLAERGFSRVVHFTAEAANRRYFSGRRDGLRVAGHEEMIWATV